MLSDSRACSASIGAQDQAELSFVATTEVVKRNMAFDYKKEYKEFFVMVLFWF